MWTSEHTRSWSWLVVGVVEDLVWTSEWYNDNVIVDVMALYAWTAWCRRGLY